MQEKPDTLNNKRLQNQTGEMKQGETIAYLNTCTLNKKEI